MSIDVMKQALRYMESVGEMDMYPEDWAIAVALRAAIEQAQKPVAWRKHYDNSGYTYYDARWKNIPEDAEPLYL